MTRPLSQLIYSNIQEASGDVQVITLHDYNQFGPDAAEWGVRAAPKGTVIALESYKGVFVGRDIVGYTWFLGPEHAPSPIFFGDSLGEIERFLWDTLDRSGDDTVALPWLVGTGQGGIMATAAALAFPDLLSGVIAINCFFPIVGGWDPPLSLLENLPILLVNPKSTSYPTVLQGATLLMQLEAWGANVTELLTDDNAPDAISKWRESHPSRFKSDIGN